MIFWGGTFIAGRALAGSVQPCSSAFLRFVIASASLACVAYIADGRLALPPRRQWFLLFILGLTGVFGYNFFFFSGLQYVEAGRASLIIALNPLAITVLATLLVGEKLSARQMVGVLTSLVGAVFVISNGKPLDLLHGSFGRGEMTILGCIVSWVTYSLVGRKVLQDLSPLNSVMYASIIGTVLLAIPALMEGLPQRISRIPLNSWGSLVFLGICGTTMGFSFYYQAIRDIGASRASVFINLVPLCAIILSWLILGEAIKSSVITGGLLLMTGVSLTNYTATKRT